MESKESAATRIQAYVKGFLVILRMKRKEHVSSTSVKSSKLPFSFNGLNFVLSGSIAKINKQATLMQVLLP